jgi:hypothetical protein
VESRGAQNILSGDIADSKKSKELSALRSAGVIAEGNERRNSKYVRNDCPEVIAKSKEA